MTKEQIFGVYAIRSMIDMYADLRHDDTVTARDRKAELCAAITNELSATLGISESTAVRMVLLEFDKLYEIVNP